jgi:hypothetical protein
MKTFKGMTSGLSILGLLTSTAAWMIANAGISAELKIVNETYDPPLLATPGGWENGVVDNLSRQYVSTGVARSTALEISATFPGTEYASVASAMFQSGIMAGNDRATRDRTELSFDLKVDSAGLLYVGVYLDAFTEWAWNFGDIPNATYSGAFAPVSLGAYKPGVFHKIVLPLNDPRWQQITIWPTPVVAPWFDPAARIYNNITLVVDSSCLAVPGSFKVTVDNVQVVTKTELVPFKGTTVGSIVGYSDEMPVLSEDGVAEHIGNFHEDVTFTPDGLGHVTLTAANGDQIFGTLYLDYATYQFLAVEIEDGTGKFQGIKGSYAGVLNWTGQDSWIAVVTGAITGVGRLKQ